jgi:hypothetical protein
MPKLRFHREPATIAAAEKPPYAAVATSTTNIAADDHRLLISLPLLLLRYTHFHSFCFCF